MLKKKIWADFQRIIKLFTQKIVTMLSKIWGWDPGSEIRDPGVKKAPDPGSRIKKASDPGSGSATLCKIYKSGINIPDPQPYRNLRTSASRQCPSGSPGRRGP